MNQPATATPTQRGLRTTILALLVVLAVSVLGAGTALAAPAPPPAPGPTTTTPTPLPGIYGPGLTPDSSVPPPTGPVPGDDVPVQKDPGFFDIPGQIEQAINEWFGHLVKLALDPVLKLIGTTLLSSPNLSAGRVAQIWNGTLITANTLYVLFVLAGAVTVMGKETIQTRYALKEIAPRLLIGAIASNASLWAITQVIAIGNALAAALMTGAVSAQGVGRTLTSALLDGALLGSGDLFMLLIGLAIAVLGVVLLIMYLVRSAVLIVLTVGSPLAFACHALPWTEGVAKLWWRAILGCVAIQVLQALVLIAGIQIFFDPQATNVIGLPTGSGLIDLLVCLCLFVVLLKIPGWVQRIVVGRSPFHPSMAGRMARAYLTYRVWGAFRQSRNPSRGGRPGSFRAGPPPSSPGAAGGPFTGPRPGGGSGGLGGWRPAPPTMTATQQHPQQYGPPTLAGRQGRPDPPPLPPPGPVRAAPKALAPGRSTRLDRAHRATVASPPTRGEQDPLFPPPSPGRPSGPTTRRPPPPTRRDPSNPGA